jgi:hypothetical protein
MMRVLLLFLLAIRFCGITIAQNTTSQPALVPISDDGWFDAPLRVKRSTLECLDLQEQEHFLWGSADGNFFFFFTPCRHLEWC